MKQFYFIHTQAYGIEPMMFLSEDHARKAVRQLSDLAAYRHHHITIAVLSDTDLFEAFTFVDEILL